MKKSLSFVCVVTALCVLFSGPVRGQQHFTPVDTTGEWSPVVIQNATINGAPLHVGDEVGIYDETLCVGVAVFEGVDPFPCSCVMEYTPPGGDPLPGAQSGNPMVFKLWQQSTHDEFEASATFVDGSSGVFGELLTVVDPLVSGATDVDPSAAVPAGFHLSPNYPNPFNPATAVDFTLPAAAETRVEIYNVSGQRIRILLDREMEAGGHSVTWDGRDDLREPAPSGWYVLRLQSGNRILTGKLLLVR